MMPSYSRSRVLGIPVFGISSSQHLLFAALSQRPLHRSTII
jgi:hypothetical protein